MCWQLILRFSCDHIRDVGDIDRCHRAETNNLPRCSELDDRVDELPDPCPDCAADTDLNSQLEQVLQSSAREHHEQQMSLGGAYGATEDDDTIRRIMAMSLAETRRKNEAEEEAAVQKALEQSRREFDAMPQATDNWTQRAKGYDPDDDEEDAENMMRRVMAESLRDSQPTRPGDSPMAGPSRLGPSVASRQRKARQPGGAATLTATTSQAEQTPLVRTQNVPPAVPQVNAADAARSRWAKKKFPPAEKPPEPKEPEKKAAPPLQPPKPIGTHTKAKRPVRAQAPPPKVPPPEVETRPTKEASKMEGRKRVAQVKTSDHTRSQGKRPMRPRAEQQTPDAPTQVQRSAKLNTAQSGGSDVPKLDTRNQATSASNEECPPQRKQVTPSDIPNWGTGKPTIDLFGNPIRPPQPPAPQEPNHSRNVKHQADPLTQRSAGSRQVVPPARAEALTPGSATSPFQSPSAGTTQGISITPLPQPSDGRDHVEREEQQKSDSSDDEASPPPSPRTRRARFLASLNKRATESDES